MAAKLPLGGSTLDVIGPITRTVRDAAVMLDVLAGYAAADRKTIAGVGTRPLGGYAAGLDGFEISGKRLGLYGPGWRSKTAGRRGDPLHADIEQAYRAAQQALQASGVSLVDDPFAGSGFADLAVIAPGIDEYDARGMESLPYDLELFLQGLGPRAALKSFAAFAAATQSQDPFARDGVLNYLAGFAEFEACRADPSRPPALDSFFAAREAYLSIFNAVMDRWCLDGLVYPQMCDPAPRRGAGIPIRETTVSELNIAGLPAVTVPAGRLPTGQPFNLIFVGRPWSESALLGMAYAWEQSRSGAV